VCKKELKPGAKFCDGCGARRDEAQADRAETIRVRAQRWEPEPGQFAVRLDQLDMGEKLESGLVIEPGVLGVLLRNGQPEAPLLPGRYQLGSLPSRKDGRMFERADIGAMVVVSSGDQVLHFAFENLRISENAPVSAAFDAVIRVRDPLAFTANVLAGKADFHVDGFLARYEGELQNAIGEAVRAYNWESLKADQKTKQQLTAVVANHLNQMLGRDGMELVALRAVEVHNQQLEKLDEKTYELHLRRRAFSIDFDEQLEALKERERRGELTAKERELIYGETAATLGHEARVEDLQRDHAYDRSKAGLADHQRRADVMHAMEQQLVKDTKLRVTNEEELANFVAKIDKDRLLRDDDLNKFKRDVVEANQDRDLARDHLLARVRSEREFELKALQFTQDKSLSEQVVGFQLEQERRRVDHDLDVQRRRIDAALAAKRAAHATELEIQADGRLKEAEVRLSEARGKAEEARIKLEVDKLYDEHELAMREKRSALDLKEQKERLSMALQAQQQQFDLQMKADSQRFQRELEEKRIDADVRKAGFEKDAELAAARAQREGAEQRAGKAEEYGEKIMAAADRFMDRFERMHTSTKGTHEEALAAKAREEGLRESLQSREKVDQEKDQVYKESIEQMGRVASGAALKPNQRKCGKCGHLLAADAGFCTECGAKLT
jgi:hypothetical protein